MPGELWADGAGYDLNDRLIDAPGWSLRRADGLNDHGWIVGTGVFNGEERGFLLIPVPEPTAMAMVGVGSVLALGWRRRAPSI